MQIKVNDLSYIYSENSKDLYYKALNNLNLTIEEGDFFGIIGHTGSGKSTFIQHLNGLIGLQKDRGSIVIGDFDLSDKKCDYRALRSKIGMVFQYSEYQLFAETVFEDVAFGVKNFFKGITEKETEELVKNALTMVGFDYTVIKDKSPFELSGGQKRRVAIAGVIVTKPEILILDEPLVGLDPKGKGEFISLLKNMHGKDVKTIIIISHDMNFICENCNRVAVFSKGKIFKEGTPKEVFNNGEELISLGLELPLTAYLENGLKKCGITVESDLSVEDFVSSYTKRYKGDKV
ncbi:MAG: energy-coupling factor transporter ATPase [Clostridia bacterium]|nr:energy-coupling factor transporter ATPase [Clostridia bacterium]